MELKIDIRQLTIGELELLEKHASGTESLSFSSLVDLLDKVVQGGVRHLPAVDLPEIVQLLVDEYMKAIKK